MWIGSPSPFVSQLSVYPAQLLLGTGTRCASKDTAGQTPQEMPPCPSPPADRSGKFFPYFPTNLTLFSSLSLHRFPTINYYFFLTSLLGAFSASQEAQGSDHWDSSSCRTRTLHGQKAEKWNPFLPPCSPPVPAILFLSHESLLNSSVSFQAQFPPKPSCLIPSALNNPLQGLFLLLQQSWILSVF